MWNGVKKVKTEDQIELRKWAVEQATRAPSANGVVATAASILAFVQGTTSSAAAADASAPIQSGSIKPTGKNAAQADTKPIVDAGTGQPVEGDVEAAAPAADNQPATDAAADIGGLTDVAPATETFDGDVAKLQSKCTALADRDGAAALLEAFNSVGAKKWSEVPADKYAELWDHITAKGI